MKDRAAKSFGGPCMSKFAYDTERKRIARLKNTKSSISSNMKHDAWTSQNVERRRKDLMLQRKRREKEAETRSTGEGEDIKFHLKTICSETTKSGLRLKLTSESCRDNKNISETKITVDERRSKHHQETKSRYNKNKNNSVALRDGDAASTGQGNENRQQRHTLDQSGGEIYINREGVKDIQIANNCLTKTSTVVLLPTNRNADAIVIDQKDKEIDSIKIAKSHYIDYRQLSENKSSSNGTKELGTLKIKSGCPNNKLSLGRKKNIVITRQEFGKNIETKNKIQNSRKEWRKSGSEGGDVCKKGINKGLRKCKLYLKAGVSLDALTKERAEALEILKEVNKGSRERGNFRCCRVFFKLFYV